MNLGQQLDALLGRGVVMECVTGAVSGKTYDALIVNASCSFTTLTGEGGTNLLTTLGLSGVTVMTGMIICGNGGQRITAVTPSGGNVFAYTFQSVTVVSAV
jgi:hypothetical protein